MPVNKGRSWAHLTNEFYWSLWVSHCKEAPKIIGNTWVWCWVPHTGGITQAQWCSQVYKVRKSSCYFFLILEPYRSLCWWSQKVITPSLILFILKFFLKKLFVGLVLQELEHSIKNMDWIFGWAQLIEKLLSIMRVYLHVGDQALVLLCSHSKPCFSPCQIL